MSFTLETNNVDSVELKEKFNSLPSELKIYIYKLKSFYHAFLHVDHLYTYITGLTYDLYLEDSKSIALKMLFRDEKYLENQYHIMYNECDTRHTELSCIVQKYPEYESHVMMIVKNILMDFVS